MEKTEKKFLKDLVEAPSPSGFEQPAQEVYRQFVAPFSDEVKTDLHGNVIALKKGTGNLKLMICGHADEIGMMVSYIADSGHIHFKPIGGVDTNVLPGLRVNIYHQGKKVRGVIGRKAIHLLTADERSKSPKMSSLFIDIGAKDKKAAEKRVSLGDVITFDPGMETLHGDIVTTKATDNKVGVWIAAMVLKRLSEKKHEANIYSVSAVQEEVGLRGSTTSAYQINPDVAFVIDVTFATDHPTMDKKEAGDIQLGKGPAISIGSRINPIVHKMMIDAATELKIPYQVDVCPGRSGTDTEQVQLTRGGVATALLSIPNRYMHTPSEVISLKDLEYTTDLLVAFIERVSDKTSFIPTI